MSRMQKRSLWVNEKTTPGRVEINGSVYNIGKYEWPHSEAAERATIGCVLAAGEMGNGNKALKRILDQLHYDDFYRMQYSYLYWAMERIFSRGEEIDVMTMTVELEKHNLLDKVGGEAFLMQLSTTTAINIQSYAHEVVDASLRRSVLVAGDVLKDLGQNRKLEHVELAQAIQKSIEGVLVRLHSLTDANTFDLAHVIGDYSEQVERELDDESYEPGITTGFTWLDAKLLGWRKRKLYIVAGSTGMGKSVFLMSSALADVKDGKRVVFISLEMPLEELLDRIICAWAEVDNKRFQERKLNKLERERFVVAVQEIKQLRDDQKLIIVCMSSPTIEQVWAKLTELELTPGFDAVFVDYAGWNTISDSGAYRGDTVGHTGFIYNKLNEMKKHFDVPVIAGCQISREHEKRKDKRPRLSDLSDSSLIEKNSDGVIFLFRPEKYEELPEYPDRAEAIIAKNRSGVGGNKLTEIVYLRSELHYNRFTDWKLTAEAENISIWLDDL